MMEYEDLAQKLKSNILDEINKAIDFVLVRDDCYSLTYHQKHYIRSLFGQSKRRALIKAIIELQQLIESLKSVYMVVNKTMPREVRERQAFQCSLKDACIEHLEFWQEEWCKALRAVQYKPIAVCYGKPLSGVRSYFYNGYCYRGRAWKHPRYTDVVYICMADERVTRERDVYIESDLEKNIRSIVAFYNTRLDKFTSVPPPT